MNWATLEYVEIFKMFVELIGGQSLEKMSIQWWTSWLHYLFGYVVNLTVGLYFLRRSEKHESSLTISIVGDPLSCLTEWQLLLTMYFAIGSIDISRLSPSDAVLRIFEVTIQFAWTKKTFFLDFVIRIPSSRDSRSFWTTSGQFSRKRKYYVTIT